MVFVSDMWHDVIITHEVQNMDYNEYIAIGVQLFTSVSESNDTNRELSGDTFVFDRLRRWKLGPICFGISAV